MLRECDQALQKPAVESVIQYALIEAFCVHARNLIEFFAVIQAIANFDEIGSCRAKEVFFEKWLSPYLVEFRYR